MVAGCSTRLWENQWVNTHDRPQNIIFIIILFLFITISMPAQQAMSIQQFLDADGIESIAFSADGRYLVIGSVDSTVRLWEVDTGQLVAGVAFPIIQNTTNHFLVFTADGRYDVSDEAVAKNVTKLPIRVLLGEYGYWEYQTRLKKRVKGLWKQLGIEVGPPITPKQIFTPIVISSPNRLGQRLLWIGLWGGLFLLFMGVVLVLYQRRRRA